MKKPQNFWLLIELNKTFWSSFHRRTFSPLIEQKQLLRRGQILKAREPVGVVGAASACACSSQEALQIPSWSKGLARMAGPGPEPRASLGSRCWGE